MSKKKGGDHASREAVRLGNLLVPPTTPSLKFALGGRRGGRKVAASFVGKLSRMHQSRQGRTFSKRRFL